MRYSRAVKPRFTAWWLALLTLAAGVSGLPASRIADVRVSYAIVSVKHKARRAEQPSVQLPAEPVYAQAAAELPLPPDESAAILPGLYQALYQRPPPASLL